MIVCRKDHNFFLPCTHTHLHETLQLLPLLNRAGHVSGFNEHNLAEALSQGFKKALCPTLTLNSATIMRTNMGEP